MTRWSAVSVRCALVCAMSAGLMQMSASAQQPRPSVFQTTLEEPNQKTPEITTEELQQILAMKSEPVFDVRTAKEYAIAHIPGTINIYEKEVEAITTLYPDKATHMILYCNGPSCGKSKRTSEQLIAFGYTNVRRYQLGLPVWRALSQTVQTDLPGVDYIFRGDRTAVFVDARTPAESKAGTVPGAVNVQAGEATVANDDGRLPFTDKGTRIVVFGNSSAQAKVVAAEIAKRAYWNSSYFGGGFIDLLAAGFVNHPPVSKSRFVTLAADTACMVTVKPADVNEDSFDPDTGDALALSVNPSGPFGLGSQTVTLTATDSHGASSASTSVVTIADQTAPSITGLAADREVLRPREHRMVLVTIDYQVSDNCSAATSELTVASSQSAHGGRRGDREPDWQIVDDHHVLLRAEREHGDERLYTITVAATDEAGNRSASSVVVRVAKSREGDDDGDR